MPLRRVFFYKKEGAESLRIFIDKENAFDRFLFLEERRGRLPSPSYIKNVKGRDTGGRAAPSIP